MASVHLEKGGEAGRRRVAFQRAPGRDPESCLGFSAGSPSELLPPGEGDAAGGSCSLCMQNGVQTGRALRGIAFAHNLLLLLSPWSRVVWAATATVTAAASVLPGHQALPLGFVVHKMVQHALGQGAVSSETGPFPEEWLHNVGHETNLYTRN